MLRPLQPTNNKLISYPSMRS